MFQQDGASSPDAPDVKALLWRVIDNQDRVISMPESLRQSQAFQVGG